MNWCASRARELGRTGQGWIVRSGAYSKHPRKSREPSAPECRGARGWSVVIRFACAVTADSRSVAVRPAHNVSRSRCLFG